MRRIRRFSALLMAVCVIASSAPVISAAQMETAGNDMDNASLRTSVEASGTGSVGRMLADAISEEQAALQASESLGYAITGLTVTGSQIDVSCRSDKASCVMVALYEESGELASFGSANAEAGEQTVTVSVSGDIPESFTASAFMIDPETKTPLCEKYATSQYIRAMRELMDASVDDYNAAQVLNLDNDPDNNFMVFDESVIRLDSSSDYSSVSYSNDAYSLQGAGTVGASLAKGDIVSLEGGNGDIIIIKVASVAVNGDTVTIHEDADFETEDAFSVIKIDTTAINENDASLAAGDGPAESVDVIRLKPTIEFPGDGGPKAHIIHGSASFRIYDCSFSCDPDFHFYKAGWHIEMAFTLSVEMEGTAEFSGSVRADIPLVESPAEVRLFQDALVISVSPTLRVEVGGEIKAKFSINPVIGVEVNPLPHLIYGKSKEARFDTEYGEAFLFMGFAFEAEVALGGGKKAEKAERKGENSLFFFSVEGSVGCKLTLSLEAKNGVIMRAEKNDGTLQHPCDVCRSGVASLKFELSGKIVSKFKFLNISPLESGLEGELPLADYYFSKINGTRASGYGICPNIRYRTNITVMDLDGKRLDGVQVKILDRTTDKELDLSPPAISDSSGLACAYLPNGLYRLTGTYASPGGDISGSQDVEIDDASAQVQLLIDAGSMRRVALTFVTSSGQPLAGLTVQGTGMDKAPVTDGNGQVVYYAAASRRTVSVEDSVNGLYWSGTVDVGSADVEKTITVERRTYAILFKISDQDGNPVSDATLTAAKSDFETTVNVMGGEAACSLPNGSYLVTVTKDGVETRNAIQVQGKTETFRFTLIPTRYTVTFDANGGAMSLNRVSVPSGQSPSALPIPTRAGYAFIGWNTAANGFGTAFTHDTVVNGNITVYAQWIADETADFAGGNGTESNPYLVRTYSQFKAIEKHNGKYFRQIADIDVQNAEHTPLFLKDNVSEAFNGVYDGGGFRISNVAIYTHEVLAGSKLGSAALFSRIGSAGVVKNLTITNVSMTDDNTFTGQFSAIASFNFGRIENVSVNQCTVTAGWRITLNTGGITAHNEGIIINCSVSNLSANLNAGSNGGIVGYNDGIVRNCSVSDVSLDGVHVGGIVGYNKMGGGIDENQGKTGYPFIAEVSSCRLSGTNTLRGIYHGNIIGLFISGTNENNIG